MFRKHKASEGGRGRKRIIYGELGIETEAEEEKMLRIKFIFNLKQLKTNCCKYFS